MSGRSFAFAVVGILLGALGTILHLSFGWVLAAIVVLAAGYSLGPAYLHYRKHGIPTPPPPPVAEPGTAEHP